MSSDRADPDSGASDVPICEYCGCPIEHIGQRCDALDEGGCAL